MLRSISISRAMPSRLRSAGMNEKPMPTALAGCCLVRSTSRPLIASGPGGRPLGTEQQVRHLLGARSEQAGEPDDLAGATSKSRARTRSPASPVTTSCGSPDRSTHRSMWNWPPCSWSSRDFDGPTMNSTICSSVTSAIDAVATHLAVAQHGHAVGDRAHRGEVVGDEDDARPLRHHLADEVEQELQFLLGKEHRRFVEHEHRRRRTRAFAVLAQFLGGAGDGDERLADRREFVDDRSRIDRRRRTTGASCAPWRASARQSTRQREYSRGAAAPTRFSSTVSGRARPRSWCTKLRPTSWKPPAGIGSGTGSPPIDERAARLGLVHAGEHLDQRRLATAVLPEQGVDLSVCHGEIHAVECPSCAELLGDVREFERGLHRCSACQSRVRSDSGQGVYGSDAGLSVHRS